MNSTSAANTSLENATDSESIIVISKTERIAWCSAFILTCLLVVVENLLVVVLFAVNKTLRKRSLFLVINMAFADLMLGTLSMPGYIYFLGDNFQLWEGGVNVTKFETFNIIFDTVFSQSALISAAFISGERFYAVYRPFKHRTLSTRTNRILILIVWTLAVLISAVLNGLLNFASPDHSMYAWTPYTLILTFIICGFNIGIWRKFQHGSVASQQQNRASQNKRLTKTLLFVSVLTLLSWLPLAIMNFLIFVCYVPITRRFYFLVNVINYSNSFVNPVVYALRIPEFKQALPLRCLGWGATLNDGSGGRTQNVAAARTPTTQLTTLRADPSHINLAFEQEVMDTKL